jgi:carbon dioxide concentrating mechanism protein CcmN
MYLPLLQPVVNSDSYIHGDVIIHPLTAIASGVILQASPDSKIIVEENVCLGMGVIIHAYGGTVTIKKGAILGAGVLLMGKVTIGSNSCVGASSTLININVEAQGAIAPGTLLGDTSRQINLEEVPETPEAQAPEPFPSPWDIPSQEEVPPTPESFPNAQEELEGEFLSNETLEVTEEINHIDETSEPEVTETTEVEKPAPSTVVGKMYVNQLLVTLFPHNQNLKKPKLNN